MNSEPLPWWVEKKDWLLTRFPTPAYVYCLDEIKKKAHALQQLSAIDKRFYAIKANSNNAILTTLYQEGIGFECVSMAELKHILTLFPSIDKSRILFTPNFAPKEEYAFALKSGCYVTIDNSYPLKHWTDLFQHKSILLRIDPLVGDGHHQHVQTAGNDSKFGIPLPELQSVLNLCQQHHIKIIGLHAHIGSGILTPTRWQETAKLLLSLLPLCRDVTIINVGGGLGVVDNASQHPLNLTDLNKGLSSIKTPYQNLQFWLEPGRYFVAQAGVLLAKVTQLKEKETLLFVGIETGMNSLIRPALYNAEHPIVNLSKLMQPLLDIPVNIVGPICETGDTLGYNRRLPYTEEGDILLIANAGAYGFSMSSHYNLRPPACEYCLESL